MIKSILIPIIAMSTLLAIPTFAQQQKEKLSSEEYELIGRRAQDRMAEDVKTQKEKDAEEITDLRNASKKTRAKANEAKRVQRDANAAARESRNAYRIEKKAQKLRQKADKQALKAQKARTKSNNND